MPYKILYANKKYLLNRYLPIVPDHYFRIRFLYTHLLRIIKATCISLKYPSATSVVKKREPDYLYLLLAAFLTIIHSPPRYQSYHTLHAYLLLPFRTLPMVSTPHTLGISTQPFPPHYIPPHPALPKPTSHYSYTLILPYPTITVEVNKQKNKTNLLSKLGRNDPGSKRPRAETTQGRNNSAPTIYSL